MSDYREPEFAVLDAARQTVDGRVILDECGFVEGYVDEMDDWCSMPVRVTVSMGAGPTLEIGPYDFDVCDVGLLRRAIDSYERILASGRVLDQYPTQ